MYSTETYYKALGFILGQIGMGETRYLISALSHWHLVELHILLSEILIQITPLWYGLFKLGHELRLTRFFAGIRL
jgi:hypothetical protein